MEFRKIETQKNSRPKRPVLIVNNLDRSFGTRSYKKLKKKELEFSSEEKILLTLIANVIIEIVLREEL